MKKVLILFTVIVVQAVSSFAIPDVNIFWNCNWSGPADVSFAYTAGDLNMCTNVRPMSCTHKLTGKSMSFDITWISACGGGPHGIGTGVGFNNSYNTMLEIREQSFRVHLANQLQSFHDLGNIVVDPSFRDPELLLNNDAIFYDAYMFRLFLAGYNYTMAEIEDPCFVYTINSPIVFASYENIQGEGNLCLSVYPNPSSSVLNIDLTDIITVTNELSLTNLNSGEVVYSKTENFTNIEIINVQNLSSGLYNLFLFYNNSFRTFLIQIE
jgi:hypothetical protein